MIQRSKKITLSKRFFPGLLPIIKDDQYNKVIARYREIFLNHEFPVNPYLRWHLVEGILPGLALYQIFRESGESQEKALDNINLVFEQLFSDKAKKMKKLGGIPFIYSLLRFFIKLFMRPYPSTGWEIEWKQNDKKAIRFDMKSCFYYDVLSKYGAPELTTSFCRVDDLIYENMSPYLLWQRTMTIARGDAYCDFCFARKKR
jgi:hypothetical protein